MTERHYQRVRRLPALIIPFEHNDLRKQSYERSILPKSWVLRYLNKLDIEHRTSAGKVFIASKDVAAVKAAYPNWVIKE